MGKNDTTKEMEPVVLNTTLEMGPDELDTTKEMGRDEFNPDLDTGPFIGSHGTAKQWLERIEAVDYPEGVYTCAFVLCKESDCIIKVNNPRSIKLDLSRFELIFTALNKYFDISNEEPAKTQLKVEGLIQKLINNSELVDLIKLGKLLSINEGMLPAYLEKKIIAMIFEKLSQIKDIEEISQQIALDASGIADEK